MKIKPLVIVTLIQSVCQCISGEFGLASGFLDVPKFLNAHI